MEHARPQSPLPGTTASETDYPQPSQSQARSNSTNSNLSGYGVPTQQRQPLRDMYGSSGGLGVSGVHMNMMEIDVPEEVVEGVWMGDRDPSSWRLGLDRRWEYVGKATIQEIVDDESIDDDAMGRCSAMSLPTNVSAPPAPMHRDMSLPLSSRGGSILSPFSIRSHTPGPSTLSRVYTNGQQRDILGIPYDMASSWFPGANPEPDLNQANASLEAHQNELAAETRTSQAGQTPPLTPLSFNTGFKSAFTTGGSVLSPLSALRTPSRFIKPSSSVIDHQQPATHPRLKSLMNDEDHRSTSRMTRQRDQSPQATNTRRDTRHRSENEPLAASAFQQPSSSHSIPSRRSQNSHVVEGSAGPSGHGSSSRVDYIAGPAAKKTKRSAIEQMNAGKKRVLLSLVPTESSNEDPKPIRPFQVPTGIIDTEEKNPLSVGTPVALFKDLPPATTSHFPEGYQESVPRTSTPPHPSRRKKPKRSFQLDQPAGSAVQSPPLGRGYAAKSPIQPIQEHSSPGAIPVPPPEGPVRRSPNDSSYGGSSSSSFPDSSFSRALPRPPPIPRKRPRESPKGKSVPLPGQGERHSKEAELMAVNSRLFEAAFASVDIICAAFLKIGAENNMLPHVNACHRVKTSLEAAKAALRRRSEFNMDQMSLATDRWIHGHLERLGSLQRSLEKLNRLADSVAKLGDQLISVNSADRGQTKLLEFATKFSGLASKFNSMFDRIQVRHVHEQMTQAYDEAKLARYDIEEDLDRWAEAKAKRAKLRYQYDSLRGRAGRRAALKS